MRRFFNVPCPPQATGPNPVTLEYFNFIVLSTLHPPSPVLPPPPLQDFRLTNFNIIACVLHVMPIPLFPYYRKSILSCQWFSPLCLYLIPPVKWKWGGGGWGVECAAVESRGPFKLITLLTSDQLSIRLYHFVYLTSLCCILLQHFRNCEMV